MPVKKRNSTSGMVLLVLILINAFILEHAFTKNEQWYWALIIGLPSLMIAGIYNKKSNKLFIGNL